MTAFNGNQVDFKIPYQSTDKKKILEFKMELFDFNSNKIPFTVNSKKIFIEGSEAPGIHALNQIETLNSEVAGLGDRIFTDSTGKISKPANSGSTGLYTGQTFLGFWNGTQ